MKSYSRQDSQYSATDTLTASSMLNLRQSPTTMSDKCPNSPTYYIGLCGENCINYIDHTGDLYKRIDVSDNGFCGFNAISFCFTGSENHFDMVIQDCLTVFQCIPGIFRRYTTFGSAYMPTPSIEYYSNSMHNAVKEVRQHISLREWGYSDLICDDGHFIAISLLYDIAIYIYSDDPFCPFWYVYNREGAGGYITLLHSSRHYEVLLSYNKCPPTNAYICGPNRHEISWNLRIMSDTNGCILRHVYRQRQRIAGGGFDNPTDSNDTEFPSLPSSPCQDVETAGSSATSQSCILSVWKTRKPLTITDRAGISYRRVPITGNGMCGYKSLSYCFTGSESCCDQIVEECVNVFTRYPNIFREHTNYGARNANVADYLSYMSLFVHNTATISSDSKTTNQVPWCEDGHLIAISLLYDIAIYVFHAPSRNWFVFNQDSSFGYVTLFSTSDHFEVLLGINSDTPTIPQVAIPQGPSRKDFGWDNGVDCVRRDYPFTYVFSINNNLPDASVSDQTGRDSVSLQSPIVKKPLIFSYVRQADGVWAHVTKKRKLASRRKMNPTKTCDVAETFNRFSMLEIENPAIDSDIDYCENVGSSDGVAKTQHLKIDAALVSQKHMSPCKSRTFTCDILSCCFKTINARSLRQHKLRCHDVDQKPSISLTSVNGVAKSQSLKTDATLVSRKRMPHCKSRTFTCDIVSCSFKTINARSLRQHNLRCHTVDQNPSISLISGRDGIGIDPSCKDVTTNSALSTMHVDTNHSNSQQLENSTTRLTRSRGLRNNTIYQTLSTIPKNGSSSLKTQMQYQQCQNCKRCFKNLERHRVCRGRGMKTDIEDETEADDSTVRVHVETINTAGLVDKGDISNPGQCHMRKRDYTNLIYHKSSKGTELTIPKENTDISHTLRTDNEICEPISPMNEHSESNVCDTDISNFISEFIHKYKSTKKSLYIQDDPLYDKLESYHNGLAETVNNVTTEKLSDEVVSVIANINDVKNSERQFKWTAAEETRLNGLNEECKKLQPRTNWWWGADDHSEQGIFNHIRMKHCIENECVFRIIQCPICQSTGILVGPEQMSASCCMDCLEQIRMKNDTAKREMEESWSKVKPASKNYPKRTDVGHEKEDLPQLQPGEKSVISPYQPIVTIKRNSFGDKKIRQESITLTNNPLAIWNKVLPRTELKSRFIILERTARDQKKRYIIADSTKVKQWLKYLFKNNEEFIKLKDSGELELSEDAFDALNADVELAEVDEIVHELTNMCETPTNEKNTSDRQSLTTQHNMESGFYESNIFAFDKFPSLYIPSKQATRLMKNGDVTVVEDDELKRATYCISANLSFPYLYPHGEKSPLDFLDFKLSRYLLKKQTLFSHTMANNAEMWTYQEDDIHMAHQFSRLHEKTVHSMVGYYVAQHPEVAHLPLSAIIDAFKRGDIDKSRMENVLPNVTSMLTHIPNSREHWYEERLGIEQMAKDMGPANLFVTLNLQPREWPDVRRLLYELQYGREMPKDEPFEKNTEMWTQLMNKFSAFVSIYLNRKVKLIFKAFFNDICRIPEKEPRNNWSNDNEIESGWYWQRVEFTETRGIQHWHCIIKLKNVLNTALLGRIIQNGRVVRQELKCGNIKADKYPEAWELIEMGLLANRYVTLFADSISTASFYNTETFTDGHKDENVVELEEYRDEFLKHYINGDISCATHPIMRNSSDLNCDTNEYVEIAKVAATTCMHFCIPNACGGDRLTGEGCRHDFPKKKLKYTVVAMMEINSDQMEARLMLRRTCCRVPNLNRYFLKYVRSNHDFTVLIDSAHSMRYATKYAAKGDKHEELLNEMVDHLNKRSTDILPPNTKQVLSHLVLADSSHRAFISKQELSYKTMGLSDVRRSFPIVSVVGYYPRATLRIEGDGEAAEFSDRTEYSAYAERCKEDTRFTGKLTKDRVGAMNFSEFCGMVSYKWIANKCVIQVDNTNTLKRKLRTRDITSGHWVMSLHVKRKHNRPSIVLHTPPAINYEPIDVTNTTSQTTFFDLTQEKRNQLLRVYYELVQYVPWANSPDETFLDKDILVSLNTKSTHQEHGNRYSLQRLEEFFKVYQKMWNEEIVAPPGSHWQRDNQFSFTMYKIKQHNRHVHLDRVNNKGMFKAQFECADELHGSSIETRVAICDDTDDYQFPSVVNFLPPDTYREILNQPHPLISEISVAFPLNHQWQQLQELVFHDKCKHFIAEIPHCPVPLEAMTEMQQWAVSLGVNFCQDILYICGRAGSGKTTVALSICQQLKDRVQAGACTGKAASNFNGPTIHSMFGWSHDEFYSAEIDISQTSKNNKIEKLRSFYEHIDVFVIDEVAAMPAASLAMLHETMTSIFNPQFKKNKEGDLLPFGGKKMIFLGDPAQLRPVADAAIYDEASFQLRNDRRPNLRTSRHFGRTKKGQLLYQKYLLDNCVYLNRVQRTHGLLGEICDRLRDGSQTEDDLRKLTFQRKRFPDCTTDYGIHYENDACSVNNWLQLWSDCKLISPSKRMFISKASYHTTADNQNVVEGLSSLPAKYYRYAPDVLCVNEGCKVRLVQNINVGAGLVNSATGTVIKVIYNNADTHALLGGKHPPPYCIIVSFPTFRGFLMSSDERVRPFVKQPSWVPIYRQTFPITLSDLPTWIRKKQLTKDCYRTQFPLDLSKNITCHRAQGQTMSNCTVSVKLGLEIPDKKSKSDIASVLYVACTRANKLENLFVSPIFPSTWLSLGKSDIEKRQVAVDEKVRNKSREFASRNGKYKEIVDELSWKPSYENNEFEWQELIKQTEPPVFPKSSLANQYSDESQYSITIGDCNFIAFTKPVTRERHIGIDQGIKNFGIVVVDKKPDHFPVIVSAHNYTNLNLSQRFDASDVLVALTHHTDLLQWMEPNNFDAVDRVIVHIEQMDVKNRSWKQFTIALGQLLQAQAADINRCVVKLAQPHVHRYTGPLFHIGSRIVSDLGLEPSCVMPRRSTCHANPPLYTVNLSSHEDSDVEPEQGRTTAAKEAMAEYRRKKKMSSDVFQYIIEADENKLNDMELRVHEDVRQYWLSRMSHTCKKVKLDDVGDALLHALDELLCGSSCYRQLVPSPVSLHNNRTIALAMFPSTAYWVVIQCTWNSIVLENFGIYPSNLESEYFKSEEAVNVIKSTMPHELKWAATGFNSVPGHNDVNHIKIVVKQLTGHTEFNLTDIQAGALTDAASRAMKSVCDECMSNNSTLYDKKDKVSGAFYIRTDRISGNKHEVLRSTGKHTNAILCCLQWMTDNLSSFVNERRSMMNEFEKIAFFQALLHLANSSDNKLEMLSLSDGAKSKLRQPEIQKSNIYTMRNLADLLLVAISKNQQYVKASASSSRKCHVPGHSKKDHQIVTETPQ